MMLSKSLAVVSAILLIGALSIATLGPDGLSLKDGLALANKPGFASIEGFMRANVSTWVWDRMVMPLFARPVWLLPAALGIICAGAAVTAATKPATNKPRRRRS